MSVRVVCPEGHPVTIDEDELGEEVVCPRCKEPFVAKKPKARRPRDEDEDEEEEKPKKKAKARRPVDEDDDDEDDDEPRKRKSGRKREDDDDEDEPKDEEPIRWTATKRQLKVVNIGLTFYQIAFWAFLAGFVMDAVALMLLLVAVAFALFGSSAGALPGIAAIALAFLMPPCFGIAFISQLVAWIFTLWSPAKSGARTSIIIAILLFLALVVLILLYFMLAGMGFFRNVRVSDRFLLLMIEISMLFLLASFIYSLQAVGRLGGFMQLPHIASQPVTLGWFMIGGTVMRLLAQTVLVLFVFKTAASMEPQAELNAFVLVAALVPMALTEFIYVFVARACYDLTLVISELKAAIHKYIKEA